MVKRGRFAVLAVVIALHAWLATPAALSGSPGAPAVQRESDVHHSQPPGARDHLIGARDDLIVIRVPMLADNLDQFAGHRVRLKNARVTHVHEPRVFTIQSEQRLEWVRPTIPPHRAEVVVLVDPGQALVEEGVSVVVDGLVRTDYGAWMSGEVAWLKELDRDILARVSGRPVVIATSVRTPDGVELLTKRP